MTITTSAVEALEREQRKELAAEMARRVADPMDRAKRKGGYYLGSDGIPHDANGHPIPEDEWLPEHRPQAARAASEPASESGDEPRRGRKMG